MSDFAVATLNGRASMGVMRLLWDFTGLLDTGGDCVPPLFLLGPASTLIRLKKRLALLPSLGAMFSSRTVSDIVEVIRVFGGGGGKSSSAGVEFCLSIRKRPPRECNERESLDFVECPGERGGSISIAGGVGVCMASSTEVDSGIVTARVLVGVGIPGRAMRVETDTVFLLVTGSC